ncbi:MAG: enoyl-CoA hydratase-related protein [Dehalococcoidia bacterium]
MSGYTDIVVEVEDPVAVIRLDRPEKLNAFTHHTLAEIQRAVEAAAADPAVVGIVITGTGRAFSAGLDSQSLAETTADGGRSLRAERRDETEIPGLFTYLLAVPKPVIAAVNGVAAGGGLVLAAKCDVRFASTAASFTTVFLKRGLIAEHGTSWLLPRLVGPGRALDLLWTSKRIDAAEAYRIGLVEYLCEPEELLDRARAYVRELAANAPPKTIADTKRLVYAHLGAGYPEAFRDADAAQWVALERPDAAEGARALLEKRAATFERLGG